MQRRTWIDKIRIKNSCTAFSSLAIRLFIFIKDFCMETSNTDLQTLVNLLRNRLDMNVDMFDYTGYQNKIRVWWTAVTEVWRSKCAQATFPGQIKNTPWLHERRSNVFRRHWIVHLIASNMHRKLFNVFLTNTVMDTIMSLTVHQRHVMLRKAYSTVRHCWFRIIFKHLYVLKQICF